MTDSTTALLNTQLPRYEIREKLGTGGMARVFRGYDTNLEREVAIKILHEHLSDDAMFKERFEREAKFVASLNHPHIVQMYDFATLEREEANLYYMVMSFVQGQTLRSILEELAEAGGHIPQQRIYNIMMHITSALNYAHEKGMIHRDVKPGNIIIDETGNAILTDFGIARMAQSRQLTQDGVTVGTPAYMSPEQATGDPIDARSDLYALGVILYEMLAGQPPFDDDGSLSVLLKHLNEPVPPLSERGDLDNTYFDAILFKALAKDPEDRYQTASAFAEDIRLAFNDQPPKALNESTQVLETAQATEDDQPADDKQAATQAKRQTNSLLGILVGGLLIALLLVAGALIFSADDGVGVAAATPTTQNAGIEVIQEDMPLYFTTSFSPENIYNGGWPQGELDNLTREITPDGAYRIENTRFRSAIPSVFESGNTYDDLTVQMRGRLTEDSTPASAYGIIFRYVDEDNYNVFAVNGQGRYSIWVRDAGEWIELRDPSASISESWTPSDVINRRGERNDLRVEVSDNQMAGYVNGQRVTMVEDDTLESGEVGIYVASTEGANAIALIDMFGVMEAPTTMTGRESMTGSESMTYEDSPGSQSMTEPEETEEAN